jgi:hypothetical protein
MKTFFCILAAGFVCLSPSFAVDTPEAKVSLGVKKQVLDSEHDMIGRQGSVARKVLTLRVEITNTGQATLAGATLSGTAIILKAGEVKETIDKEPLGKTPVPELRPGGRVTLEVGRIALHEREWRNRKIEESLEAWKVVCVAAGKEIGMAESGARFSILEERADKSGKGGPANPGRKKKNP